jgi:hypothetical protein
MEINDLREFDPPVVHKQGNSGGTARKAGRSCVVLYPLPLWKRRLASSLRACFENISGGLAAGRGSWLRCSSVEDPRGIFSFVGSEQIRNARFAGCLAIRPAAPAIPFPIYFQNTLLAIGSDFT